MPTPSAKLKTEFGSVGPIMEFWGLAMPDVPTVQPTTESWTTSAPEHTEATSCKSGPPSTTKAMGSKSKPKLTSAEADHDESLSKSTSSASSDPVEEERGRKMPLNPTTTEPSDAIGTPPAMMVSCVSATALRATSTGQAGEAELDEEDSGEPKEVSEPSASK